MTRNHHLRRRRRLGGAAALFLAACGLLGSPALRAQASPEEIQLEKLSETLLRLEDQTLGRSPASAAEARRQAEEVIGARVALLETLIAADADKALTLAFPQDVADRLRQSFPDSASGIEFHGAWVGMLEGEIEDGEDFAWSAHRQNLQVGPERFAVYFASEQTVESGQYILAEGMLAGTTMALSGATVQTEAAAGQACSTTGDQRFAVIKVKIGNPTTANPSYPNATIADYMFGSGSTLSEYWREASHGAAWATGDVYPTGTDEWYDLTSRNYSCNSANDATYYGYPQLRNDAIAAADGDIDYNNYERVLVVFSKPNGLGCFAGVASIGCWLSAPDGSPSISYALQVFEYMDTRSELVELTSHEGGHNLGLYHSSSKDYGAEPLGAPADSGSILEYGDRYSAVGFWNKGHYPPQHNNKIGWMNGMETITSNAVRTVLPNNQSGGLEALKIKRGTDGSQYLWLEYRRRLGNFYSTVVNSPTNGALIHLDNGTAQSMLLDFTPNSQAACNSTYCLDFYDAPLQAGQTWSDPYSNLSLTVNSATNAGLEVAVNYGSVPCTASPATVSVSPASQSTQYPSPATYSVTVTNNDTSACSSSVYTLTPDVLDGGVSAAGDFSLSFDSASLTIAPGGSQSANLTVTPVSGTTAGNTYQVKATAGRTSPSESVSDTAGLTVTTPTYTVTVNITGKGTVNLNPPNQNWSSSFSQDYLQSGWSPVALTATPDNGQCVQAVTGCTSSGDTTGMACNLTTGGDYTINVEFKRKCSGTTDGGGGGGGGKGGGGGGKGGGKPVK